jgi:hypothetical protein
MKNFHIKNLFILMIRSYQFFISPFFFNSCRFFPSCSSYAIGAVEKHGVLRGAFYSIRRIVRCHPFNCRNGYDPVP